MSRYNISHNKAIYSYGIDNILGLFFEKSHVDGKNFEIVDFDVSEMINFVDHPKFVKDRGRRLKYKEVLEIIEWEVEENDLPINQIHLNNLREKKPI